MVVRFRCLYNYIIFCCKLTIVSLNEGMTLSEKSQEGFTYQLTKLTTYYSEKDREIHICEKDAFTVKSILNSFQIWLKFPRVFYQIYTIWKYLSYFFLTSTYELPTLEWRSEVSFFSKKNMDVPQTFPHSMSSVWWIRRIM